MANICRPFRQSCLDLRRRTSSGLLRHEGYAPILRWFQHCWTLPRIPHSYPSYPRVLHTVLLDRNLRFTQIFVGELRQGCFVTRATPVSFVGSNTVGPFLGYLIHTLRILGYFTRSFSIVTFVSLG